jgi:DnaJ-class molecular chaperone
MDYALALDCKGVRDERDAKGRVERCLAALGYIQTCGRCGGGGHYSRNSFGDTRCYDCTGRGTVLAKVTKKIVAEAAKRVAAAAAAAGLNVPQGGEAPPSGAPRTAPTPRRSARSPR